MPDKIHFGYGFACDGPGRGGTCDISAWDSFYLATYQRMDNILFPLETLDIMAKYSFI